MTFSTHKQKFPSKNPLFSVQNLYATYVSLRRSGFVVKMIKNGLWQVKNSLVMK